jgi:uncharacterized membrane protein
MERIKLFLSTSLLGGLVVVLPVVILLFIFSWIFNLVTTIIQPLTTLVVVNSQLQETVADILVIIIILSTCFAVGVFVRTRMGSFLYATTENRVLKIAPGYSLIKETVMQILNSNKKSLFSSVALVQPFSNETLASAFITDRHVDGSYTVFVPTGPNPTSGNIFHLKAQYVHPVDVPVEDALRSIISCGVGSRKLINVHLRNYQKVGGELIEG